jgi:tRNA A-37 threonylcarbamoyl transferase component Bud32/tetratricopeptide (TPR) repeat protein
VAAGRHAEAAAQANAQGEPLRAAAIYERIWEFGRAALCARAGGDLPRALRNAIDARDEALVVEIASELAAQGTDGQRAAMEAFAQRRRFGDAGERAEAAGDLDAAIAYYQQAHRELDAARLLGQAGRDREAGRLLERMIAVAAPGLELAQARLALGRLLLRRMQYAAAAAHLQEAAQEPATRDLARRSLIVALAGMGLRDAARDVLVSARADEPALPADLESFLQAERADEWAGERAGDDRELGPGHAVGAGPSRQSDEPTRIAGRYRLDDLLGAGGSGRVYRAHDEVTGRSVAIKIFSLARDHQAYERFVREARVTTGLDHANIVQVFDFSAEHGYLVMEHMPGGSLATRLGRDTGERGRHLSVTAVRRLALDVLAGLERAHRRGVIHRDIKPANVFFDVRGTAKLGDFGVAHLLDLGQTQTGGLIGTLAYMAPEQITGAPLTIAADLYALGVTLYEALTGRLPFLGPDFVAEHLGETPPPVSSVAPEGVVLAAGWDAILARLLAKSPSERFESVDGLRKALEALALDQTPRPLVLPRRASTRDGSRDGDGGRDGGGAQREPGKQAGIDALTAALVDSPAAPAGEPGAESPASGAGERYQFETPIGRTDVSHLSRALDTVLDRSVIIERYVEGGLDQATERRLLGLARGGSSCVQWALACDRAAGVAVFEAPRGVPLGDALGDARLDARAAVRLLACLARAVSPMHERGVTHGAIGATTVLLDEQQNPTLLVCGLGRAPAEPPLPREDVRDILRLVARSAGVDAGAGDPSGPGNPSDPSGPSGPGALAEALPEALAEALVEILVPGLAAPERAAILAPEPHDGAELYAFAERLEIALLRAEQPMASEGKHEL